MQDLFIKYDFKNIVPKKIIDNKIKSLHDYYTTCHANKFKKTVFKDKYDSILSNNQFKKYFQILQKQQKEDYILNLQILLNQYLPVEYTIELIDNIKNNKIIYDNNIYHFIFTCKNKYSNKIVNEIKNNNKFCSQQDYIVSKVINTFLYQYKKKFKTSFFEKNTINLNTNIYHKVYFNNEDLKSSYKNNFKYLQIGIDTDIQIFKKKLNLEKENIYQADLYSHNSHNSYIYPFQMIHSDGKINYPDHYFNFIHCGFIFENIQNLPLFISELKRILKPNGFILMYYHDKIEILDKYLYDIEKVLKYFTTNTYSIENFKKYQNQNHTYNYFSNFQWYLIFLQYGLHDIGYGSIKNTLYYQPQFQTLSYYIFIKD